MTDAPTPGTDLTGRLLVATPLIGDPHFHRTVVLLLVHGEAGALGVVLNRPSGTAAHELVPGWGDRVVEPSVMFLGGPVGPEAVIGLGPDGTVDFEQDPAEVQGPMRLFAGSAGWTPDQLEGEIAEGAWWVVDDEPGDRFTADPDGLWSAVLARQGGERAWFAHYPEDPASN